MNQLGIAVIAGNRARSSMFTAPAAGRFQALGGVRMGASNGLQIYQNAKSEVANFDALVARVQRVANQIVRDQIIKDYGLSEPDNKDKALYMRNAVAGNIAQVDSYSPPNYLIYETGEGPNVGRVTKLHNFNSDLASTVKDAELTYGILPEPVTIERMVLVGGPSTVPDWVIPVAVAGVGIGLLAIFGVF